MQGKVKYEGKVLRVNLTNGEVKIELLEEKIYRSYLGGSGLASYFLLKELEPGVDPLGPDNLLIFSCSIITGIPVAGASRFTVAAKSPLTGGFAEAEAGGWWAPEFKKAGFDVLVIRGRSSKPVYLWICDGEVEIRDASKLTGKSTGEAEKLVREELGDKRVRVAQIGPAGERMVKYACIVNECKHFNGRVGLGAVMGSKKLRAVVVRGTQKLNYVDKNKVKAIAKKFMESWKTKSWKLHFYGTSYAIKKFNKAGILPTHNFRDGSFKGAEAICGERMVDKILIKRGGCYACPVRCKRVVKSEGKFEIDPYYGGPEYETLASLGSLCGIDNLKAIAKGNELCNKYGLDTISTGNSIAFAMECFEKGIITKKDTNGIDLKFGNAAAMIKIIEKINKREGIGDILANGVMRSARNFGNGAEEFSMHVKGQEIPMHDPRGKVGLGIALGYSISPTGADHLEIPNDSFFSDYGSNLNDIKGLGILEPINSFDSTEKKVRLSSYVQKIWSLYNNIGLCNFTATPFGCICLRDIVELVEAVTGWKTSLFELIKVAERTNTMARCFNVREGFNIEDDVLPERFFKGLGNGPLKGKSLDKKEYKEALKIYYIMQGWDEEGIPTKPKLAELDLDWVDFQR